jgi:ABC-type nitrate/sulfonate/bicarbonate transport system substrate-binding protein
VTSTRAFVKAEPKTVNAFLNAYVNAIQLIKKIKDSLNEL